MQPQLLDPSIVAALRAGGTAGPAQGRAVWKNGRFELPSEPQTAPQKQKGKGGFLSSIISELSGAGGAAAGAAYGATAGSIIPGAGTLVGGILGGAIGGLTGGFGGRVAENKIRDNRYGFGDAAKEGALSGVFGAGGEAFQGLRAARTAGIGVAEALKTAPKDLQAARAAIRAGSALKGGERVAADAYNLLPGSKVGSHTLSTTQSKELLSHVQSVSKAVNPEQVLADLENHITQTGKQIGTAVEQGNRALTKAEVQQLTTDSSSAISKVAGLGEDKPAVQQFINDLKKVKDLKGLQEFRQSVADQINFGKVGGTKPGTQQALRNLREVVAPFVDNNVAGLSEANQAFSLSKEALPFVQHNVANPKGLSVPIKGPLGKLSIGGRGTNAARGLVGKTLQAVGGGEAGAGILKQQLKLQGAKGLAGAISGLGQPQGQTQGQPQDPTQLDPTQSGVMQTNPDGSYSPTTPGNMNDTFNVNDPSAQAPPQQGFYNLQNFQSDAARDPKHLSDYLSLLKYSDGQVASANKLSTASTKLPAAQQLRKDALSQALGSLDSATANLTSAGGAQGPKGNLATIPGIGQYLDPHGAAYHNTKIEIATSLAKAVTGGSRVAQNVIDHYMKSLPDVNDTPEYAASKVAKLQAELYAQARRFKFNDLLPENQGSQQNDQASLLQALLAQQGYGQ